jgi:hypothetical protein
MIGGDRLPNLFAGQTSQLSARPQLAKGQSAVTARGQGRPRPQIARLPLIEVRPPYAAC